ncbi:MAG: 2-oxoacid:acceptor oxidoreductase family protein [Lachnospiraceae bacterium]|nr:2-oxoacid:acceptor oxidoreductase family protein [Candidatus Darwinimomas equi]
MITRQLLISGFGGQGLLFMGKALAYKWLMEGYNVSWLPSYGPEMRGGTANCGVVVSENHLIGSPLVANPNVLICMNLPSLDKYEDKVVPGGMIFVDSTMIERKVKRTDVDVYYIPASKMASDNNMIVLANMIMMGKVLQVFGETDEEAIKNGLSKCIPPKKAEMFDVNMRAIQLGLGYEAK